MNFVRSEWFAREHFAHSTTPQLSHLRYLVGTYSQALRTEED